MKIAEKLKATTIDRHLAGVTIAFLGDSVTQGCFELYMDHGEIKPVFEQRSAYCQRVFDILATLYPRVPVHVINAGRSGDRACKGVHRLERDVLSHAPDLVVVCYGLNDCRRDEGSVSTYQNALREIFATVQARGCELIFMTPNMMNTTVSPHVTDPAMIRVAEDTMGRQNDGIFDAHLDAARTLCAEMGVPVCDCYKIWQDMYRSGVNVTELLSNKINHPTREMHSLFAYELVKMMLREDV